MRAIAAVALAMLVIDVLPAHAEAQVVGGTNGRIDVTDATAGVAPGPAGGGGAGSGQPVYAYWAVAYADGGFCRERRYTYDQAVADAYNYAYHRAAAEANGAPELPACPTNGTTSPPPPTPEQLARDFWDVRHLPNPTLAITPDYAVTGKTVYLRIGNPQQTAFHVDNPIGPAVDIGATSAYVVDWGDGTSPTTTTSQGGPWPDGDVTHVYDRRAPAVTISVTQRWSATWRAADGSAQGSLDALRTGSTLTLRVEQVQPVRNR